LTSGGTVFNGRHQIIRVFAQTFNGSFHPYLTTPTTPMTPITPTTA
jgi:hypothetical protein